MLPAAFLRAVSRFDTADTIVIEFTSGDRLIVWEQVRLDLSEYWCSYIDDGSVSHDFDPSTVVRVMGWTSLPDLSASPYPYRNGRPQPPGVE